MSQETAKKHSLWLMLPDLQPTVNELAAEVGNPTFVPHVTLIGNYLGTSDEAMALAKKIAGLFNKQLVVDFSGFETKNEESRFFCFLANPNDELDELYSYVHELYGPATQETFRGWPHVSLLYGTERARSIFPDLGALSVRYGTALDGPRTFGEITVLDTSGEVEDWTPIGRVALTQDPGPA